MRTGNPTPDPRAMKSVHSEAKARAVAWLTAWDSQGPHRTATAGDEAGARWLAHEATGLGVEVATEAFELSRLDPVACYLGLGSERIPAVPAFDAPATSPNGVTGTLSLIDHEEAILVAKLAPQSVYTGEYERLGPLRTLILSRGTDGSNPASYEPGRSDLPCQRGPITHKVSVVAPAPTRGPSTRSRPA